MQPEMRTLPDQRIVFVERRGYVEGAAFTKAATEAFNTLMGYVEANNLQGRTGAVIGYMPDDMNTVAMADQRYVACFAVLDDQPVPASPAVQEGTLPGGKYAVFTHKGPWATVVDTWMEGWNNWFPTSGMAFRPGGYPLEIYLNGGPEVKPEDLRTEVCLPVE